MDYAYSFFLKTTFSRETLVFNGALDVRPERRTAPFPVYHFHRHTFRTEFSQMTSTGPNLLLTAKIRGFCSRLAEVRTPSNTLVAKAKGVGFYEWSFAYAGAVFQWKVSKRRKQWSLVDPGGRVVASFDRASRLSRKEGVLRVVGGLDQQLVRLCMLTCKMVHDTITMIEGSSASGGAGGGP